MNWEFLITTLGGTSIAITAIAWLSKHLISTMLLKDVEKYKNELKVQSSLAIEGFKSQVQLEAEKKIIEYSSLHAKRGELIAEIYNYLFNLNRSILSVMFEYGRREIREELDNTLHKQTREPWELKQGIDTLDEDEEKAVKSLSHLCSEFYKFYGSNKIYLSPDMCALIDKFSNLASYTAFNYQNVSIKDKDGELMVNPKVKEAWNQAVDTIPIILEELEKEFRSLLGVSIGLAPTNYSARTC